VHCREFTGSTPLLCAATGGHTAVVSELLQHGAQAVIDVPGRRGLTPLMAAVQHTAAVKALLAAGASVSVVNALTKDTALHEGEASAAATTPITCYTCTYIGSGSGTKRIYSSHATYAVLYIYYKVYT
jgi:ankyrin repeat protein